MTLTTSAHDSGDRAQFLKLFIGLLPGGFFLLSAGEGLGYARDWYGGWIFLLLLLLNVPAIYGFSLLFFRLMDRSAAGIGSMVYAAGNIPPDPAHSAFESLTARGFYPEAVEAYRAHLIEKPGDNLARVKLADLYIRHLNNLEAAEQLYLDIRRGKPSPKEDRLASNLLIELYRKSGRRDRLMVELGRFAEQFKGTRAAEDAARTLHEMKEEMRRG